MSTFTFYEELLCFEYRTPDIEDNSLTLYWICSCRRPTRGGIPAREADILSVERTQHFTQQTQIFKNILHLLVPKSIRVYFNKPTSWTFILNTTKYYRAVTHRILHSWVKELRDVRRNYSFRFTSLCFVGLSTHWDSNQVHFKWNVRQYRENCIFLVEVIEE